MIISHRHEFVFVAIPKTGTHSVRQALRQHLGPDDIEQVKLFVDKQFPYSELARLGHGHISLEQVRPFLGEEAFSAYFKFAFVRNPFDRFVSYCAFVTRQRNLFGQDPKGVMRHFLFAEPPEQHILFKPQHDFIVDTDGGLLTNAVGRVEEMQDSYQGICTQIGIPTAPLAQANASSRGHYRQYYDQQLIDAVAARYRRDLDIFGYDF